LNISLSPSAPVSCSTEPNETVALWVAAQKDGGHLLKVETKRELEVTFAATGGAAFSRHFAEGGTGRVEIHAGAVVVDPIGMIDEVERFGAELEAGVFGDCEFLE
jgi:hypothetical protein